jgi:hypothetical protein
LGVAGVGLNGIPAVNDRPVLYEKGIRARMPFTMRDASRERSLPTVSGTRRT